MHSSIQCGYSIPLAAVRTKSTLGKSDSSVGGCMCRCAKIHLRCDRSLSTTPHAPLAPLGLLHTCSSGTLGRAYAWTLGLLFARVTASPIESNQGASCYSYVSSLNLNLTSPNNDAGGGMEDNNRAAGSTCTDYSSTD